MKFFFNGSAIMPDEKNALKLPSDECVEKKCSSHKWIERKHFTFRLTSTQNTFDDKNMFFFCSQCDNYLNAVNIRVEQLLNVCVHWLHDCFVPRINVFHEFDSTLHSYERLPMVTIAQVSVQTFVTSHEEVNFVAWLTLMCERTPLHRYIFFSPESFPLTINFSHCYFNRKLWNGKTLSLFSFKYARRVSSSFRCSFSIECIEKNCEYRKSVGVRVWNGGGSIVLWYGSLTAV